MAVGDKLPVSGLKRVLGMRSAWSLQKQVGRDVSRCYRLEMLSHSKARRDPGVLYALAVSVTKGLPAQNTCLLARTGDLSSDF